MAGVAPTIPFAQPALSRREKRAICRVLRSGWLTSGVEVELLEQEFATACNSRYAIATSSATAGLHIGLEVLGLNSTSALYLSPYTYTASAMVATRLGAQIVFVDIEPDSLNIDPLALERQLAQRPQTKGAIMPIHIGGHPCKMPRILELARSYSLAVIEDAAHSQPTWGEGGAVGAPGDCRVFSFYATKPICSGEGGMIVTESPQQAAQLRILGHQGVDRAAWQRSKNSSSHAWHYDVIAQGYKYNLPDLLAAMARVQLSRATQLRERRYQIARRYHALLAPLDWLELPPLAPRHAWHLFVVTLRPKLLTIERDKFMQLLAEQGINCSLHYIPLHITSYWRRQLRHKASDFPHALQRYRHSFSLPLHATMRKGEVSYIAETLQRLGKRYRR